jgi:hypothetical protein
MDQYICMFFDNISTVGADEIERSLNHDCILHV